MSTRSDRKQAGGPYRRPRPDVYTVVLVLALLALLLGIVCLYAEMADYDFELRGKVTSAAPQPAGTMALAHCPLPTAHC